MPVITEVFAVRYKTSLCAALDPQHRSKLPDLCLSTPRALLLVLRPIAFRLWEGSPWLGVGSPLYAVVLSPRLPRCCQIVPRRDDAGLRTVGDALRLMWLGH